MLIASSAWLLACVLKALTLNLAAQGFSVWLRSAVLAAGFFAAPLFVEPVFLAMRLLDIPTQPRLDQKTLK